jgi:hypothetical protein
MTKETFINNLCKENSTFSSTRQAEMVANLLDTVSTDIYSESQRFVFELIQNADDSANTTNNEVHFDFLPNCLIVSHNGKAFDESDIISLTGAGASTKRADPTKTGYKGIGFKSVFGKSERVTIFSDGYQFRFDKSIHKSKLPWQIIPLWTEPKDLDKEVQESIAKNKYNVSTIIEVKKAASLLSDLNELLNNGQILLFLRRISKISVSQNGKYITSIEKRIISQNVAFNEVTLSKDGKEISSWLTKSFEKIPISSDTKEALNQDDKTPEKLKEAEFTEISFAAKIEEGKIKALKKEESLIFTYLPTKVSDFEFPFLVNGSFITNAAREGLHEDRIWNQWLFKLVAAKILDWLEILASSKFSLHILHLLPEKTKGLQTELRNIFFDSLIALSKEKAFVPSKSMTLKKPTELIIDKTGLSDLDFISTDTLIEYINQKENTKFKNDSFINSKLHRTDKLRLFGAKFFDAENLESFFLSPVFKQKHQPSENFSLIEYFYTKANKEESKEWNEKLKEIPFIFTEGEKLKSPQSVCFPTLTFETEFGDGVTLIHNVVYTKIDNNSKVKSWLEQLGVKEPSDLSYLENEIIGDIENCINQENYLQVTRYLFNQHKKSLLTTLHYDQLQALKLFTTTNELIPANQCFLSDIYEPSLRLQKVNNVCKFISDNYKQDKDLASEWKTFFLYIGVVENVELKEIRLSNTNAKELYRSFLPFFEKYSTQKYNANSGGIYHNTISTYSLTVYSLIEFSNQYDFSKHFWEKVLKIKFKRTNNDKGFAAWQNKTDLDENLFSWCVENADIFPTTLKDCRKASEVFISDKEVFDIAAKHLPVFDYSEPITDDWRTLLPFKDKLELNDYLTVLEKIAEQTEEDEILRKYNRKKIGLIYNKLSSLLPNYSEDKKEAIKNWATENKLLSANGQFESAKELKWIKIDGFTTASEKLKIILFPENCDINSKSFEELISLFQVQIIDKFIPTFEKEKMDFELKNKLQNILPYFVAIIEKKQYADFTKEFDRLFSVVTKTEFFNAAEIKLSFKYQKETIEGASLNVFRELNSFYFKGRWRSPITMFTLIPELSSLLEVTGLNDELRLLLQLDEAEIIEWLTGLGYDIPDIKAKPEYQTAKQKIKIEATAKTGTTTTTENEVAEPEEDYQEYVEVQQPESFEPEVKAQDIDATHIKPRRKKFVADNSTEQPQYQEIADDDVRFAIGRWSEEFVFKNLHKWGNYSEIVWENEIDESGKPYDFKLVENGKTKFIEVKGTPSSKKDLIYLSSNEWNLMFEQKDNYILIRVYNAGKTNVFPEIIENPSQQVEQGSIQVALRV